MLLNVPFYIGADLDPERNVDTVLPHGTAREKHVPDPVINVIAIDHVLAVAVVVTVIIGAGIGAEIGVPSTSCDLGVTNK